MNNFEVVALRELVRALANTLGCACHDDYKCLSCEAIASLAIKPTFGDTPRLVSALRVALNAMEAYRAYGAGGVGENREFFADDIKVVRNALRVSK